MQLIFLLSFVAPRNFAILFNASKDFCNYRHSSNVLILNKLLTEKSFEEDDILYLLMENVYQDKRNACRDVLHYDTNKGFTLKEIYTTKVTLNLFLNILDCNHPKMRDLDESSNVFIYLCGHGGDGFLKILDRNFLLKDDLLNGLQRMSRRVNKIFFVIDTCQAETLIDSSVLPDNVFALATSIIKEPSVSYCSNSKVGCAVIDGFPRIFYDKYRELSDLNIPLNTFLDDFTFEEVGSHLVTFDNKSGFLLSDFFVQHKTKDQKVEKFKHLDL